MKNLFRINVLTYLFLLLSFFAGYFREIVVVYLILIVHEFGHFFLMKYFNIEVNSITVYPYGGMIKSNMLINTNSKKVLLISLGGVISQIILWFLIFLFYKFEIISNYYYEIFYFYNISLIIFNLIPIYPLDGFKILNSILEMFLSFKNSIVVSLIINFISLVIFFCYLYMNRISNYVIILFLLIGLIKYVKGIKYIYNKFYIERFLYEIEYNGLRSVKSINKMYKNNFNYIGGIGENEYLEHRYSIF